MMAWLRGSYVLSGRTPASESSTHQAPVGDSGNGSWRTCTRARAREGLAPMATATRGVLPLSGSPAFQIAAALPDLLASVARPRLPHRTLEMPPAVSAAAHSLLPGQDILELSRQSRPSASGPLGSVDMSSIADEFRTYPTVSDPHIEELHETLGLHLAPTLPQVAVVATKLAGQWL